jgi:hypothetical protein
LVKALSSVLAWLWKALVDVGLAVGSDESRFANASVLSDAINALAIVLARLGSAVINVLFAVRSGPAISALASVLVDAIDACSTVEAWVSSALINVDFAIFSFKASRALASVSIDSINADTIVLARRFGNNRSHQSEMSEILGSAETAGWHCRCRGDQHWQVFFDDALINVDFAVLSFVASRASALVVVDLVGALTSVHARLISALVDVGLAVFS